MTMDWLWFGQVTMAALVDVAFAFAVGSALLGAWLDKDGRAVAAPAHIASMRAQRSAVAAAVALLLAQLAWLLYEAAAVTGATLTDALPAVPTLLAQTHVGHAWAFAFAASLVLLVTTLVPHAGRLRDALLWLAVIAVAAGRAASGHAADDGLASAALGIQTLHVLTTGVWGGLVMSAGFAVLPALGASTARGVLIRIAGQLSSTSFVAVLFVIATGVFRAVRGTGGSLAPLTGSTWGHLLVFKLTLVALAVVLGGLNRFQALPRLRRTASTMDAHTFANVLYLEALAITGAFIAAAALAHSLPGAMAMG